MRTAIVDDEMLARQRIREFARPHRDVDVIGEAASGFDALSLIEDRRPDLLFLDVQMPEMNGFDVLAALRPDRRPQAVIFTTAYDQYAVDAFAVSATDYLLKPFTRARFDEAVSRARERMQNESRAVSEERLRALLRAAQRSEEERLAVRTPDATELVPIGAIDWVESEGNYVNLHIGPRQLLMRDTITNLEERLANSGFVRIHRALLVNSARIVRMEPWSHGELVVVLRDGKKLKSGRTYSESLRRVAVPTVT